MKVHTNLSAGKEVVILFLDLSRAFNIVDADTLLTKRKVTSAFQG